MLNCMTHIKFLVLFMATVPAPGILHSTEVYLSVLKGIDHSIAFAKDSSC